MYMMVQVYEGRQLYLLNAELVKHINIMKYLSLKSCLSHLSANILQDGKIQVSHLY